jgi:thiol:disulfide interchange protein DsbC
MKKNIASLIAATLLLSVAYSGTIAADAASTAVGKSEKQIRSVFAAQFPDTTIDRILVSPWPGMYELDTSDGIVYSTADASLLFFGKIVNSSSKTDLTADRVRVLQSIDFASLPFELAIKTVKGDGARKIAVFADPDCPFCRKLEQSFKGMTNMTVYTFLNPIEQLHPQAGVHARNIWCSPDQSAAWHKCMEQQDKTQDSQPACDNAVLQKLRELSDRLKITGTPTMFFADGRRVSGAITASELELLFAGDKVVAANR